MKSYLTKTNIILTLALFVIGWFFLSVESILLPFILAFVLAYILHPLVVKLERRHIGRGVATGLVVSIFCLLVVAFFLILIPILQAQVIDFMRHIPQFSASVWNRLKSIIMYTRENMTQIQLAELSDAVNQTVFNVLSAVGSSLSRVLSSGVAVFNLLALILITPVVLFYVLRDWRDVKSQIKALVPKKHEQVMIDIWNEINKTLAGFIRGQSVVCLFLAIFYALGLCIADLQFGILVGLLAGIFSFIPYFGFGTGLVVSLFLGLMQGLTWTQWGILAVVFSLGQLLESYILTPRLVGSRVGLHPVWVIFALLAGGVLFGFLGILLAVPVAAVLGVFIRRGIIWYQKTEFYLGKVKSK